MFGVICDDDEIQLCRWPVGGSVHPTLLAAYPRRLHLLAVVVMDAERAAADRNDLGELVVVDAVAVFKVENAKIRRITSRTVWQPQLFELLQPASSIIFKIDHRTSLTSRHSVHW